MKTLHSFVSECTALLIYLFFSIWKARCVASCFRRPSRLSDLLVSNYDWKWRFTNEAKGTSLLSECDAAVTFIIGAAVREQERWSCGLFRTRPLSLCHSVSRLNTEAPLAPPVSRTQNTLDRWKQYGTKVTYLWHKDTRLQGAVASSTSSTTLLTGPQHSWFWLSKIWFKPYCWILVASCVELVRWLLYH